MSILVIGGAGYIGSHNVHALLTCFHCLLGVRAALAHHLLQRFCHNVFIQISHCFC